MSFQEVAQRMKKEAMAESYGGDGTVLGSAKAETFFGHTMAQG